MYWVICVLVKWRHDVRILFGSVQRKVSYFGVEIIIGVEISAAGIHFGSKNLNYLQLNFNCSWLIKNELRIAT